MDTAWTWAHYSEDSPFHSPVGTGDDHPAEAKARQALAGYIAALGSPHTEAALRQLRVAPTDGNAVVIVPGAVFTTRIAGPHSEAPRPDRDGPSDGARRTPAGQPAPEPPGEPDAILRIDPRTARIRPKDLPILLRGEGCLIGLSVVAAFLMTGTGIRAWVQPENNVADPILLLPGLALFFAASAWTSNWRRRAVAHIACAGRAEGS
ncbi:hypothetical protein [Streptomyces sp. NPDC096095]|uniref:hypothetical protein n=1 Tax=Streptomyces sp. NPDC096095 TaxID=3155545 RepID=UPI00332CE3D8